MRFALLIERPSIVRRFAAGPGRALAVVLVLAFLSVPATALWRAGGDALGGPTIVAAAGCCALVGLGIACTIVARRRR